MLRPFILFVWRDCVRSLYTLPTFGYGLESFPRIFPTIQSGRTSLHWPNTFHESAHNYLLDTMFSKGLPGLVVALALSASAFFCLKQMRRELKLPYAFCLGGHIACLTSCMFFTPQIPTLLYLYLPVCLIWASNTDANLALNAVSMQFETTFHRRVRVSRTILVRSVGIVLIVYSACLLIWDNRIYKSKLLFDLDKTEDAVSAFGRARQIAPPGVTAELWFSHELIYSSAPENLTVLLYPSLTTSIAHEEQFANASILLAAKMISDGRRDDAKTVLERIIQEFPAWPLPKKILNTLEIQM